MNFLPRGRFAVAASAILWGVALATNSSAAAAGALLTTFAVASALATIPHVAVEASRSVPRDRYTEEETVDETLTLRLLKPRRVRAEVVETATEGLEATSETARETLLARTPTTERLSWRASTWGAKRLGPVSIVVKDALALAMSTTTPGGHRTVSVLPRAEPLGKFRPRASNPEAALGAHSVSKPGDGFEFFALRGYVPGDNVRRINWKASARAGSTIVNQVTRDSYARVVVFVDLRAKETLGPAGRAAVVRNGRAAASILHHHERMKDHLTLVAVTDEARRLSLATNPRVPDLLESLAATSPCGFIPLDAALRAHLAAVRPRSPVYFVTSGALDETLRPAILLAQALNARPIVVAPAVPEMDAIAAADAFRRTRALVLDEARALGVPVAAWDENVTLEGALLVA